MDHNRLELLNRLLEIVLAKNPRIISTDCASTNPEGLLLLPLTGILFQT
jgi:hypothetical protein